MSSTARVSRCADRNTPTQIVPATTHSTTLRTSSRTSASPPSTEKASQARHEPIRSAQKSLNLERIATSREHLAQVAFFDQGFSTLRIREMFKQIQD
jgi:hypothetical protein